MGRFVFIEGLPGTGKSSIAKNLADSLAAQGISTRLILEAAPENPLRFNTGTDQSIDVVRFVNSIMKQWVKFTQAQAGAYPRSQGSLQSGLSVKNLDSVRKRFQFRT